ncbi:MAG: hypothetical protein A2655_03300 [Candidatus Yanofskybacteria bacterium RIFCSPHIGHO2_01_FULL_43_42]|uniref:Uncharacterized protein n=1 Tax=Candidatus Yanofskybacteria bacterium RIFCSPLOWO2_01_FULL_43_22 TaxID=1802695 RepID=A0A1F8GGR9_9BACT|nr:MAG: hypothetical protein A2655_03300 [Candidatus Yanofskybacteria bacterium RIFCSPHIGHO2_01_FULL_43_42]OGN13023.1 MAG: hypothetical protein A3D48_03960 [Candidatus Yanofskybacteria bacterium RIFCSPHIGHO2_02_FULL_43_17]OGN23896.1 MAG: hypothetical protein A3A13_02295 [Candidatus Yanofskybacteria bacterium RIFCSPLOWO2_01_FULL_43_22]
MNIIGDIMLTAIAGVCFLPCVIVAYLGFTKHKDQGFWILLPLSSLMAVVSGLFFVAGLVDSTIDLFNFYRAIDEKILRFHTVTALAVGLLGSWIFWRHRNAQLQRRKSWASSVARGRISKCPRCSSTNCGALHSLMPSYEHYSCPDCGYNDTVWVGINRM